MKKLSTTICIVLVLCFTATITSFAGTWQQDSVGWWYAEDNGNYLTNQWKEIDGKQYYFGADGYMLSDTTTPDGYKVGPDGAWVQDEQEKIKTVSYGQYSIDPLIFEEMNSTAGQLRDKYASDRKYTYARGEHNNSSSRTLADMTFSNAPFKVYTIYIYTEPKREDYVPEYDLNQDGVIDYHDELIANSMTGPYQNMEYYEGAAPYLHSTTYYDWNKEPYEIKADNLMIGFSDSISVEELGSLFRKMGATNVEVKNENHRRELTDWKTDKNGGLLFIPNGKYEDWNSTSIKFTLNGLTFFAYGKNGQVNINTMWTIKHAE